MRTGASREIRAGFPYTYSSATRSPMTTTVLPWKLSTRRRSRARSALDTVGAHYTDRPQRGKRFFPPAPRP